MSANPVRTIYAHTVADAGAVRQRCAVTIAEGRIVSVEERAHSPVAAEGLLADDEGLLVPGFIDIHIHGGAGVSFMVGGTGSLDSVGAHLASHGVTGYLSSTVTGPWEGIADTLRAAADRADTPGRVPGAAVLGSHLEGPFINPIRKGAQPEPYIRPPSFDELQRHAGDAIRHIKVATVAPEVPGGLELVRQLVSRGIIVSVGHSDATYEQICAAIDAGARHTTHTFNAMRQMTGRDPGVAGAAMSRRELIAELIWDNIHVHPASCMALAAAKGREGLILISDGIPGAGMPDGYQFSLGDIGITVHNGSARLPDGTLAGSVLTLDVAFGNASALPLTHRCAATSHNAAQALGLGHRKGLIRPGYDADMVLLSASGEVQATVVGGQCVYRAPSPA